MENKHLLYCVSSIVFEYRGQHVIEIISIAITMIADQAGTLPVINELTQWQSPFAKRHT